MKKQRGSLKQLKNFAPNSFKCAPIKWNKRETKIINWIEKRYQFDIAFELHEHLSHIPIDIMSFKEYERLLPTNKETVHSLKVIKEQSIILKTFLNDEFLPLMAEGIKDAETLLDMLEITGSKHRALIAENNLGRYKTLHETINSLETFVKDDYLFRLPRILEQIIIGIDKAKANQPPPKRGRKKNNLERGIIHKLIHIYTNGTSNVAICHYHRTNERYYGKFYFFMMTALTLLRGKVKIKVMQRDTWGDYARETIKYHYRDKQKSL